MRSSAPRGVARGEIGMVAKIAAANSRPMTDQAFMTGFPRRRDRGSAEAFIPSNSRGMSALVRSRQNFGTATKRRFVPKADYRGATRGGPLFNHLVGARQQRRRHVEAKCLCSYQVYDEIEFGWLLNWEIARLCPT